MNTERQNNLYKKQLKDIGAVQIEGFEGYYITKNGDIYSIRTSGLRKMK